MLIPRIATALLGLLESRTRLTRNLVTSGASGSRITQSAASANQAYDSAHTAMLTALAEMEPLLSSKLSLFEAISAKMDLDRSMADFDLVGVKVKAVRP